jgi:hypothetical protein
MNNFDKYIKDRLEQAQMQPGENVWDKIAASGAIGAPKPFILPLYRKIAVAAALFIGIGTVAFFWLKEEQQIGSNIIADEIIETPLNNNTGIPLIDEGAGTGNDNNAHEKSEESEKDIIHPDKTTKKKAPTEFESQEINRKRKKSMGTTPLLHERQMSYLAYQPVQTLPELKIPLQSVQPFYFNEAIASQIYRVNQFELDGSSLLSIDPEDLLRLAEAEYAPMESKETDTIKDKFFQFAGDRLNAFADAAGLPWRKLSKVNELEILY